MTIIIGGHSPPYEAGGRHNKGSAHGCGKAIDIRIWEFPYAPPSDFIQNDERGWISAVQAQSLTSQLQDALGSDYRIINERLHPSGQAVWLGPHIHIEYKP